MLPPPPPPLLLLAGINTEAFDIGFNPVTLFGGDAVAVGVVVTDTTEVFAMGMCTVVCLFVTPCFVAVGFPALAVPSVVGFGFAAVTVASANVGFANLCVAVSGIFVVAFVTVTVFVAGFVAVFVDALFVAVFVVVAGRSVVTSCGLVARVGVVLIGVIVVAVVVATTVVVPVTVVAVACVVEVEVEVGASRGEVAVPLCSFIMSPIRSRSTDRNAEISVWFVYALISCCVR